MYSHPEKEVRVAGNATGSRLRASFIGAGRIRAQKTHRQRRAGEADRRNKNKSGKEYGYTEQGTSLHGNAGEALKLCSLSYISGTLLGK